MTSWAGRYEALRERLRDDAPRVLLLGAGGAGKTEALSLAADELRAADRPVVSLRGRRLEASQPFAPFEDPLAGLLPAGDGAMPAGRSTAGQTRSADDTGRHAPAATADATEPDARRADEQRAINEGVARRRVVEAVKPGCVLLVDDVQWFDPASLRVLVALADRADEHGLGVVVAQRAGDSPDAAGTSGAPELAELRTVLGRTGPAIRLGLLTPTDVRERVARRLEAPVDDGLVDAVTAASGGLCWLVDTLVDWWRAEGVVQRGRLTAEPPAPGGPVADAVARRLAHLDEADLAIARAQALGAPTDDDTVLAVIVDMSPGDLDDQPGDRRRPGLLTDDGAAGAESADRLPGDLGQHLGHLRLEGLLTDGDRVPEAVRQVLHDQTPVVERRRLHRRLADALSTRGAPRDVAEHLLAAGATGPAAAERFVAAGDACPDPAEADRWYERAVAAGAPPATVAARRAETALLTGDVAAALRLADSVIADRAAADRARALNVAAAGAAATGDWSRAHAWYRAIADASTGTDAHTVTGGRLGAGPGRVAGVCAALAALIEGRVDEARRLVAERSERPEGGVVDSIRATVDGLLLALAGDHRTGVQRLRRAADLLEVAPAATVLPDSPHAIGAVVELLGGDPPAAAQLVRRAIERRIGGGFLLARHRLLLGWAYLREARWPEADATLADAEPTVPRDRLLAAALAAGLARRRGDLVELEHTWHKAEPLLLSIGSDLLSLEPMGELAVAAGRLDQRGRARDQLQTVGELIDAVGAPVTWAVTQRWIELAVALNSGDHGQPEEVARRLDGLPAPTPQLEAYRPAAAAWAAVVRGEVDPDAVRGAVDGLHAAGWSWEAAQLAGQAAIRVGDAAVARDLLGRAREVKTVMGAPSPGEAKLTGLSEREVEVARLVVEGRTQKEIGALLYISAKTVEHHVAKIRQKLGAETRAEMLAALRTAFEAG